MKKGLDFMLKGIGPKDKTPESEGETLESGVMTQESGRFSKPFWSACSLARCGSSLAGAPGT